MRPHLGQVILCVLCIIEDFACSITEFFKSRSNRLISDLLPRLYFLAIYSPPFIVIRIFVLIIMVVHNIWKVKKKVLEIKIFVLDIRIRRGGVSGDVAFKISCFSLHFMLDRNGIYEKSF